jgi:hypothetical protein
MDNQFFEHILANAAKKKEAEQAIKSEIVKQSKEVLLDYIKPVLSFLDLVNSNYSFKKNTQYEHLFKFSEHNTEKVKFDIEKNGRAKLSIIQLEGRDYIHFHTKEDLKCVISMSENTVRNFKEFETVEDFITYFAELVVAVGELKEK